MISTPFIIHDENSSVVPTKNKFLQKSTKLGPGFRGSPSKQSFTRNSNSAAPRKALGFITSNDLNTRAQQPKNVSNNSNTKGLSNSNINILTEKESTTKNSKVESVQAKTNCSKAVPSIQEISFHDDDMLCTRKQNTRSLATLDPYNYCMDLVAARLTSNDPNNALIADYPPLSSLSMQLSEEELKFINEDPVSYHTNNQVDGLHHDETLFSSSISTTMDPLIPDYSLYAFEEPTLLFDSGNNDNSSIEVPLIILPECDYQQQQPQQQVKDGEQQDINEDNLPSTAQIDINSSSSPASMETSINHNK